MSTVEGLHGPVADIGAPEADLDASTDRYARRFSGPAGRWLLARQTRILRELIAPWPRSRVLDVGGGHGQVAAPLREDGHAVHVHASSARALGRAAGVPGVEFGWGSLTDLPHPDRSFDVVTSFRILAHVGDWERLLAEACRVARHAVIVDFPAPGGFNLLEPVLFGLKRRIEGDTRRYVSLSRAEVSACARSHGFAHRHEIGQFVLPMVLHRKLARPAVSDRLERTLRAAGLGDRAGSPVIARITREAM
ncbi:class I SAM-dependent methyltransferase [Jannaschia sp. W003]|uniref:class I SAM-dependent methyltransferase n=1 Tax=Jannaschia sp. W003 TaxID=2867012 RepID=UPI0021A28722|nr:class I SAM-dependent methyltransferase [Jannaschia sp. W003]UWQ21570.1 class I SAM-dependent methyltransferase [Jannaschia sp. W003]